MTAFQRLLKHPHPAVFDKRPLAEPVMRVRNAAGLSWSVADEVLSLTAAGVPRSYDLATLTVGGLYAALERDGITVDSLNPVFAGLSATVLVDGSGGHGQSNGDSLPGFLSPLWALYSAYAKELRAAGQQVIEALKQMVIGTSEGEWLDLWGTLYDVPRRAGEGDTSYAENIPREAFRIRVNALAIEQAILDATGKDVQIEEPWGLLFRLDESRLSGESKFYDGDNVGYHLIRPVARQSMDWSDVLPVIERNRAAGVLVLAPETRLSAAIDGTLAGNVWLGISSNFGAFVPMDSDSRLDYMRLSDEEITRNWAVIVSNVATMANTDPLLDPVSIAFRRDIAMASIALSEGPAFGDENFVFPREEITQLGGDMAASDNLALSSPDQKPVLRPVDRITSETHPHGELTMPAAVSVGVKPSVLIARFIDGTLDGTSSFSATAGFTWATAGNWGQYPWGMTQQQAITIETAVARLDRYTNTDMRDDLA